MRPRRLLLVLVTFFILGSAIPSFGGPPFVTDDPEPVELHHWEVYFFSIYNHTKDSDFAQIPAIEVNYGIFPETQLHIIAPGAYDHEPGVGTHFGYGDTELGVKYRFLKETDYLPQAGIFPLVELPTGDSGRGLGNGQTQIFIPIWLQKSFGKDKEWTTYGGGGFWYNPGPEHANFFRFGWELQRDLSEHVTLGGEIYHETPDEQGGHGHTAFNLGGFLNFDEHNHFLFTAGRDLDGPTHFACYIGYQFTF